MYFLHFVSAWEDGSDYFYSFHKWFSHVQMWTSVSRPVNVRNALLWLTSVYRPYFFTSYHGFEVSNIYKEFMLKAWKDAYNFKRPRKRKDIGGVSCCLSALIVWKKAFFLMRELVIHLTAHYLSSSSIAFQVAVNLLKDIIISMDHGVKMCSSYLICFVCILFWNISGGMVWETQANSCGFYHISFAHLAKKHHNNHEFLLHLFEHLHNEKAHSCYQSVENNIWRADSFNARSLGVRWWSCMFKGLRS